MREPLRRKPPRVGDRPATRKTLLAFVLVTAALLLVIRARRLKHCARARNP